MLLKKVTKVTLLHRIFIVVTFYTYSKTLFTSLQGDKGNKGYTFYVIFFCYLFF